MVTRLSLEQETLGSSPSPAATIFRLKIFFSTFAIDHGTDMLVRHMVLHNPKKILDLGCGYGPMGVILAKTTPDAEVTMVDTREVVGMALSTRGF